MSKLNSNLERGKALCGTLMEMLRAAETLTADYALAVLVPVANSEQDTAMLLAESAPKGKALDCLLVAHFAGSLYLQQMLEQKTAFRPAAGKNHTVWAPGFRRAICSKLPEFEQRFQKTHQVLETHRTYTNRCGCAKLLADMKDLSLAYAEEDEKMDG